MKRMDLGSVSLDLVPGPDNPRNSEGAFLTLPDGEILYAYSRYKGKSCSDEATTDLCLLRSRDDGRTFGEESTILTCEGEDGVNAIEGRTAVETDCVWHGKLLCSDVNFYWDEIWLMCTDWIISTTIH